jgi:hypothetical protein
MALEVAPQEAKSQFEQSIVETIDTGYVGKVTKQLGKEKITLGEFAELLGDKAPSAQIIDELNLLEKNPSELGVFARTSDPSELANGTIFLGTKFVDKDKKVWFKTFVPANPNYKSYHTYTQSTAESKFYGLAIPTEEAVDYRQE